MEWDKRKVFDEVMVEHFARFPKCQGIGHSIGLDEVNVEDVYEIYVVQETVACLSNDELKELPEEEEKYFQ